MVGDEAGQSDAQKRTPRQEKDALPDVVAACRLDEHLVHVALGALVHALVDLVDEGERRACELGEREQVRHGRQGALLRACQWSSLSVSLLRGEGKRKGNARLRTGVAR